MAGLRRWSVFLTAEGAGAEAYEPPLPDELQAALPPDLAASVQFRPSVVGTGGMTRHYRLNAGLGVSAEELARGLAGELERRIAHLDPSLAITVEVREEGGDLQARLVARPAPRGTP